MDWYVWLGIGLVVGWMFIPNPQWSADLANWITSGVTSLFRAGWAKVFGPRGAAAP